MRRLFALLACSMLLAPGLRAAPLDAALQDQLLALFDSYNKAMLAGKLGDAAQFTSGDMRASILAATKGSRRELQDNIAMARLMAPDSIAVLHARIDADGTDVSMIVRADKTIPADAPKGGPKPGSVQHSELTLAFHREAAEWKLTDKSFGIDPAQVKACHDAPKEAPADYDENRQTNLGGMIRRVEFTPDHTLLVIRVLDEDNCAIMVNRDELVKHHFDPDLLKPFATVEIGGWEHRTDKQRLWVTDLNVTQAD